MKLSLQNHIDKYSIVIYVIACLLGLAVFLSSPERSVSFHYEHAAQRWMGGESLYADSMVTGGGFIYLPQAALIHIPFALVSKVSGWVYGGDVVWRVFSWALFACAAMLLVPRVGSLTGPNASADRHAIQWRVALMTSLLGLSCLRIGQSTLLMTALILLSLEAWYRQKWVVCSLIAVLAVCVKPLAIVPLLLYFAIAPKTRVPLLFFIILAFGLPLAMQSPDYAWQQYRDCATMLQTASHAGTATKWAQLFGMCAQLGIEIPVAMHNALRMLAAITVLAALIAATRMLTRSRQYLWFFAWTAIYLMLFNPRTENSTYAMLGPLYGLWIGTCHLRGKYYAGWGLFVLALGTMGSYELGKFITPDGAEATWLAPLCCCIFSIFLGNAFHSELTAARVNAVDDLSISQQAA